MSEPEPIQDDQYFLFLYDDVLGFEWLWNGVYVTEKAAENAADAYGCSYRIIKGIIVQQIDMDDRLSGKEEEIKDE